MRSDRVRSRLPLCLPVGLPAPIRALFLGGALLACPALGGGTPDPFAYRLDDGAGSSRIGPSDFDANMTWLNTFSAEPGRERITRVLVSFGGITSFDGVSGSDLVTVAVLDDPTDDGDPGDAVLLATGTGVWTAQAPNVFLGFDLDAPAVVDGVFFVAVMMDVVQRASPARLDPQGQGAGSLSWLFYNPGPNLGDLGSSPFVLRMSDSPFLGAWMVRAEGTGVCEPDLAAPFGVLNFFDVSAYIAGFSSGDPSSDLAEPFGVFNFFDISAFVALFGVGCG